MISRREIEKARSILLRGNDLESAVIILEAMILNNYIEVGGRVNTLKVATRQIINFVNEYKTKDYLDIVREKVEANNKANQLETDKQKLIEYIEKKIGEYDETIIEIVLQNVLAVAKGEESKWKRYAVKTV